MRALFQYRTIIRRSLSCSIGRMNGASSKITSLGFNRCISHWLKSISQIVFKFITALFWLNRRNGPVKSLRSLLMTMCTGIRSTRLAFHHQLRTQQTNKHTRILMVTVEKRRHKLLIGLSRVKTARMSWAKQWIRYCFRTETLRFSCLWWRGHFWWYFSS